MKYINYFKRIILLLSLSFILTGCNMNTNNANKEDNKDTNIIYQELDDTSICINKDIGLKLSLVNLTRDEVTVKYEILDDSKYYYAYPHDFTLDIYDNSKQEYVSAPCYACVDYIGPELNIDNVFLETKYFNDAYHSLKKGKYKINIPIWYTDNKNNIINLDFDNIEMTTLSMYFTIKDTHTVIKVEKYNDLEELEYNLTIVDQKITNELSNIILNEDYISLPCDGIPNYKIEINNKVYYLDESCKCIRDTNLNLESNIDDEKLTSILNSINSAKDIK